MARWTTEYDKFAGYDCMRGAWEVRSDGRELFVIEDPEGAKAEEVAKRVVTCVNACEGINPEAVPELLATLKVLRTLLARDATHYRGRHRADILEAAIAKAEAQIPEGGICGCTDFRCPGCDTPCNKPATELVYAGPGGHPGSALCKPCASWIERAS